MKTPNFKNSPEVDWSEEQITQLVSGFYSKPHQFRDSAEGNIAMALYSMLPWLITNLKRWLNNAVSSDRIVDKSIKQAIQYTSDKLYKDWFLNLPLRIHYNISPEIDTRIAHINYLRQAIHTDPKFKIGIKFALLHAMQSKLAYWKDATTCPAIREVFSFLFKAVTDNSLIQEYQHRLLENFQE